MNEDLVNLEMVVWRQDSPEGLQRGGAVYVKMVEMAKRDGRNMINRQIIEAMKLRRDQLVECGCGPCMDELKDHCWEIRGGAMADMPDMRF